MEEMNKAMAAINQHDACDDCGKRTDGLMTCTYAHDGSTTKLCPDCIKDSGFCLRCGNYCAGMSSFDFSDMPGYCSDCRREIKDDFDDDDWDNDPYDPFDDWGPGTVEDNNQNEIENV
jgi:hypothetical protein